MRLMAKIYLKIACKGKKNVYKAFQKYYLSLSEDLTLAVDCRHVFSEYRVLDADLNGPLLVAEGLLQEMSMSAKDLMEEFN